MGRVAAFASRREAARVSTPGAVEIARVDAAAAQRMGKLSSEGQLPSEDSESNEADGRRRCIDRTSSEQRGRYS